MCVCHSFAICLVCSQFYAGSHFFQSQVRAVVRAGGWGAGQSFCVLPARTARPLNCCPELTAHTQVGWRESQSDGQIDSQGLAFQTKAVKFLVLLYL